MPSEHFGYEEQMFTQANLNKMEFIVRTQGAIIEQNCWRRKIRCILLEMGSWRVLPFSLYPLSIPNCMFFSYSAVFFIFLSPQDSFCANSPTFTWSNMNALKQWPHSTTSPTLLIGPCSLAPLGECLSLCSLMLYSLQRTIYYFNEVQVPMLAQSDIIRVVTHDNSSHLL